MLILSEADLSRLLQIGEVIRVVEMGFQSLSRGEAFAPERLSLPVPSGDAVLLVMPSRAMDAEKGTTLGTKIVSVFPNNSKRGLDLVQATYLLLDGDTGAPLALMGGKFITAIRTAATSAVATKYLAGEGTKRLTVFGAGLQARFHIEAMLQTCEIGKVMITSRTAEKAFALAEEIASLHRVDCTVLPAAEALSQADIICTCTTSPTPLFDGECLQPGVHINAVGAFTPSTRELDTETVRRSSLFIDSESAAGKEAGEIFISLADGAISPSHIKGTLAELVSGKVQGRQSPREITLFKSCGLAIEDLVTTRLAYEKALADGTGLQAPL